MLTSKFNDAEVIEAGHPPVAKGIVCVDFDGTIFPFGQMDVSGTQPMAGAAEAVRALKKAGYTIVIFTSRLSRTWHNSENWDHRTAETEQTELVRNALEAYDIPWDDMTAEKIPAVAYFDDKAWRAEGPSGLALAVNQFLIQESGNGR